MVGLWKFANVKSAILFLIGLIVVAIPAVLLIYVVPFVIKQAIVNFVSMSFGAIWTGIGLVYIIPSLQNKFEWIVYTHNALVSWLLIVLLSWIYFILHLKIFPQSIFKCSKASWHPIFLIFTLRRMRVLWQFNKLNEALLFYNICIMKFELLRIKDLYSLTEHIFLDFSNLYSPSFLMNTVQVVDYRSVVSFAVFF